MSLENRNWKSPTHKTLAVDLHEKKVQVENLIMQISDEVQLRRLRLIRENLQTTVDSVISADKALGK